MVNRHRDADQAEDRWQRAQTARRSGEYGFASVRMEGLEPGPEAEAIARRFIEGELSHEEYHAEMRRLALDIAK